MTRQGKIPAPLDLLIAAHGLSLEAVLVTNDRARGQVDALTIDDWSVETPGPEARRPIYPAPVSPR